MKRRPTTSALLCLLAAAMLSLSACQSTTDEEPEPPSSDTGSEFDQGDVADTKMPTDDVADTTVSTTTSLDLETAYFDFDRSEIRSDARPVLRANANQLRASGASVRLEGYCDERGDEEYNLALGEKRATAVKRYLENLGVSSGQMRTLSYGEAKPAVPGHNEAAWRYNRRVEFHAR